MGNKILQSAEFFETKVAMFGINVQIEGCDQFSTFLYNFCQTYDRVRGFGLECLKRSTGKIFVVQ